VDTSGIEILQTLQERVAPAHTALLVIDMQNDYAAPGGATEKNGGNLPACRAIIPPMARLIDAGRRAGAQIVFTKYTVGPGAAGLSGPELMRRGMIFKDDVSTIRGSWGHELIPELSYAPEVDLVVDKRRPSSFVGTDLDVCLRCRGIKTLVVTGVATSGCVESTVRDAVGFDYYVAVVEDCVAAPSSEENHRRAVDSMRAHIRYTEGVTTSERLISLWG
jgi:nicotinamidase-related amidase